MSACLRDQIGKFLQKVAEMCSPQREPDVTKDLVQDIQTLTRQIHEQMQNLNEAAQAIQWSCQIMTDTLREMESRQSIATPHGSHIIFHMDAWCRGQTWVMPESILGQMDLLLWQGTTSYGQCKNIADERRGQMIALESVASRRPDATYGDQIGSQNATGHLGWYIPQFRHIVSHRFPEIDLDQVVPVPQWAQAALRRSAPDQHKSTPD